MMRTAIYARVSTEAQAERQTIESQLTACREFCAKQGYEVAGEFPDDGVSGAIPFADRPEGAKLLDARPERVIIYCPDRLGRDITEALLATREFKRLTIAVEFVSQSFDDTPEGRFTFQVFLAVAELERALIARRMKQGRQRKVRQGAYMCNQIPYGYRRDGINLTPSAWEAEIIHRVFAWCIAGDGLQDVCNRLRNLRIPPPSNGPKPARDWHTATIHRILTNRRYVGESHYGDLPMVCPAIVDRETFDAAQAALTARKAYSGPRPKHPYLLKGRVFCRTCGHLFYVDTKSRGRAVYSCGGLKRYRDTVPAHTAKTCWQATDLEGRVRTWATAVMGDPNYLLASAEDFEWVADRVSNGGKEEAQLEARVVRLTAERQRLIDLRVDGTITHDEATTRLSRIDADRSKAMVELRAQEEHPADGEVFRLFAAFLRDCAAGRESLGEGDAAWDDVDHLVGRVWVEPDGELTIEGTLSLPPGARGKISYHATLARAGSS